MDPTKKWFKIFLKLHLHLYIHSNLETDSTGKSVSEALILESVNPQYDNRLFIELQVQHMKIKSSEHAVYKNCF